MNQIAWQIYGGSNRKANTFIGGVASTITTSGALATKLGIASNRITNFKIVGSDIECRIKRSYVIPDNNWQNDSPLTYYQDNDGLVTSIGTAAFKAQTNYLTLYFPGITNGQIGTSIFQDYPNGFTLLLPNCTFIPNNFMGNVFPTSNEKVLYIPRCTSIGSTELNNNCLEVDFCNGGLIYAPISKQTSNAGGVEGDLAFAIANNATVRYVTNFTAPNPITDLSTGTITSTTIQLNFTAPTGSTNAIEFYEVYVNGVYNRTVTASGQYITGLSLNTAYTIEVKPVDIFYNKSTSNVVSQTTLATQVYQDSLVSYYKMENNVLDSVGTNNGTATAITYASGLVGQTAVFNGSTSVITVPDNDTLTFANATNDLPFSIGYSIKTSDTQFYILSKTSATLREYECFYAGGQLGFRLVSNGNAANRLDQNYTIPMAGAWINVIHTYNGLGNGGMKTYVNGVLAISTNTLTGTYAKMQNTTNPLLIGNLTAFATYELNGQLDEVSIFNTALTAGEVAEINAKLNTGQSLI